MPSHLFNQVRPRPRSGSGQIDVAPGRRALAGSVAARAPGGVERPGPGSLHISKLRGISLRTRSQLKRQGITYTTQLLEQAGTSAARAHLAGRTGIPETELLRLVRRADLARIKGIGAIFADMLELVGIHDVGALAARDAAALHDQLYRLNAAERFARRAPTPDEVIDWVGQARTAAKLLDGQGS